MLSSQLHIVIGLCETNVSVVYDQQVYAAVVFVFYCLVLKDLQARFTILFWSENSDDVLYCRRAVTAEQ